MTKEVGGKSHDGQPGITGRTPYDLIYDLVRQNPRLFTRLLIASLAVLVLLLITGFASLVLGWLAVSWSDGFHISLARPVPDEVAERIAGRWTGRGADIPTSDETPQYTYKANLKFTVRGRKIEMDGDYEIVGQDVPRRIIHGEGDLRDDYARLNYEYRTKENPGAIGYGVMFLHIPPSGTVIHGRFAVRSMLNDSLKTGTLEMKPAK